MKTPMRTLDRTLGGLMIIGALLHGMGSHAAYKDQPMVLLWALSATFAELLLAALNLLRASRPDDFSLASVTLTGNLAQLVIVGVFGKLVGNLFDFRVVIQASITIALTLMSVRTLLQLTGERRLA